jgi:FkbM family methyltransferase
MPMLHEVIAASRAVRKLWTGGALPRKAALQYLRVRMGRIVRRRGGGGEARLFGFRIRFLDYRRFIFLVNEVFVDTPYLFPTQKRAPFIIDCGANIGTASLFFKSVYPDAEILAFEPDPETYRTLTWNLRENSLAGVTAVNKAVGDAGAAVPFYSDPGAPGDLRMSLVPQRKSGAVQYIECVRLSGYVDREVDFLKIDVEGAEHAVLKDLSDAGRLPLIRSMIIEYHHNIPGHRNSLVEILSILEHGGFHFQVSARLATPFPQGRFQDMLIYAYRPAESSSPAEPPRPGTPEGSTGPASAASGTIP